MNHEFKPGCRTCANCPSEHGNIACMCEHGAFVPDHPDRSQEIYMQFEEYSPTR